MMPHRARAFPWGRALAATLLAATLAACGTTVPAGRIGAGQGPDGELADGDGTGGGDGPDLGGGPSAEGGSAGGPGAAGRRPGAAGSGSDGGGGGGGGGGGVGGHGRGVTDKTIKVGIEYAENADQVVGRFGGPASGDWRVQYQAVIDDLNARGGVLGRQIEPVWLSYSFDGEWAAQEQAACAEAVDDEKVFAVLAFPHSETGLSCYERGGVVQISGGGFASFDDRTYRTYKHLAASGGASFDRLIPVWIDNLATTGFFEPGAKIGVVTHEAPKWQRATRLIEERLAIHGLKVTRVARTTEFSSARDGENFGAGIANAILRFQQDQISHVLFMQGTAFGAGAFMAAADPQEYRPKYGLTTNDGPWATSTSRQTPRAQLQGVRGVGFAPHKDVVQSQGPSTPGLARCRAIFAARNLTMTNQNNESSATLRCDHVWLLEEAIEAGGPTINRDTFLRGLEAVGRGLAFSATFGSNYTGDNRDGFGEVRAFAYDPACDCMKYTSGPIPVP